MASDSARLSIGQSSARLRIILTRPVPQGDDAAMTDNAGSAMEDNEGNAITEN